MKSDIILKAQLARQRLHDILRNGGLVAKDKEKALEVKKTLEEITVSCAIPFEYLEQFLVSEIGTNWYRKLWQEVFRPFLLLSSRIDKAIYDESLFNNAEWVHSLINPQYNLKKAVDRWYFKVLSFELLQTDIKSLSQDQIDALFEKPREERAVDDRRKLKHRRELGLPIN
jgi:hypothetical protein